MLNYFPAIDDHFFSTRLKVVTKNVINIHLVHYLKRGITMKKLAIASALLSALAITSTAHAYQAEVGGSYVYTDIDNGDSANTFAVDGAYYFKPVQVRNSPLNEAAFLDRASNINADLSNTDFDDFDITTFNVGVEYFVPNSDFYLNGRVGLVDTDAGDTTTYSAEVGYLPVPGFLIAAGLAGEDVDGGDNEVDPTLRAKYVTQAGQYDINLEANARFGDDNFYGLGGDLYLDKTFSVGAAYTGSDADGVDDDVFAVRAKKFFNQQVSLEGSMGFGDDYNTYGIRGAYRF